MKNPKFEVFKSEKSGQFYFRLKALNGQIILSSEGYTSKQACLNGVESVKKNAADDGNYDRKDGDTFSFTLKAKNKETIGKSESYTTKSARENGIESVKKNAPDSPVEELL